MRLSEYIIDHRWISVFKIVTLILVSIALLSELLPETEAKVIVVPTLIIVLVLGIIEIQKRKI